VVQRWELGSEFHCSGLPEPPLLDWPKGAIWYMLGRHVVSDLVKHLGGRRRTLWLPSYFCPEVADRCHADCSVREYGDDPRCTEPDWNSLRPEPSDVVLAVNYFGVRSGAHWAEWRQRVPCVLLEDHTQDPFSPWASNSSADYCFASLRKTIPIPDGAILWSPRQLSLPAQPDTRDWSGSALKLAAMFHKAEYLKGKDSASLKERFRTLQREGEAYLRQSQVSAISPYAYAYVSQGIPHAWRQQRLLNTTHLLARLQAWDGGQFAFRSWPDGAVPFALIVVFSSQPIRDSFQSWLQKHNVYCPVHWVCQTTDKRALDLAQRILSLPVDQRYTLEDMDRVANVLSLHPRQYNEQQPNVEVTSE
jgi:hypothetical protein